MEPAHTVEPDLVAAEALYLGVIPIVKRSVLRKKVRPPAMTPLKT